MKRGLLFAPLAAFAVIALILYAGFDLEDPNKLPSALVDKPFPDFELPDLLTGRPLRTAQLVGEPRLVNVWATWCPTCLAEHDTLLSIAEETGLSIVGINYRDQDDKARKWLSTYGNPYDMTIVDRAGDLGIDLGVYGAPESFLVDADGIIRFKHVGDVNPRVWARDLAPVLAKMNAGASDG